MDNKKYIFEYWLKNQSKLFSEPNHVVLYEHELIMALTIALENDYEIKSILPVE